MKSVDGAIPDEARSHFGKGNLLFEKEEFRAAILEYDEALRLAPSYHNARFNRALTREIMGDTDGALPDLLTLVIAESERADVWYLMGRVIARRYGIGFARIWFQQAISKNSQYSPP